MPYIDLSGKRFGHWTVIRYTRTKPGGAYWLCQCDCGKISEVHGGNLTSGKSTNCGCLRKKRITHGLSKTRIYNIYIQIKKRCYNQSEHAYPRYGGRGIKMCDSWFDSFESFYEWSIKNGYSEKLTIDRINNDGDYCPENCRWVSYEVQSNNTRRNIYISINGETRTLSKWCKKTGILYTTAYQRIRRGIEPSKAIMPIVE